MGPGRGGLDRFLHQADQPHLKKKNATVNNLMLNRSDLLFDLKLRLTPSYFLTEMPQYKNCKLLQVVLKLIDMCIIKLIRTYPF